MERYQNFMYSIIFSLFLISKIIKFLMLKINQSMQETNTCFNAMVSDCSKYIEDPICTLDYLIEKYGPFDLLKMDCEGCEYDIVLHRPETLESFEKIGLEYHIYNTRIPLSRLIEQISRFGFSCSRVNT
ncbi:MAG: FkbM family methyltransferase [Nanopusillaceae archaeon]